MKKLSVSMQSKILSLRRKYKINSRQDLDNILDSIIWYSLPIVYPNCIDDSRLALSSIRKQNKRRWRYKRYVRDMVTTSTLTDSSLFLCSLTFDDYNLSLSSSTRRQFVSRYLSSVCEDYMACIDYGSETGREHYHAICSISHMMVKYKAKRKIYYKFQDTSFAWSKGFSSFRKIESDGNIHKLMNYAFKASNYAFKNSDSTVKPFHKKDAFRIEYDSVIGDLPY